MDDVFSCPGGRGAPFWLKGPGAMLFIRCRRLPPPVDRGLKGAYAELRSVLSCIIRLGGKLNAAFSIGVVGVALRDLEVGKGGNALSCDIVNSGDGGPTATRGAARLLLLLLLLENFENGDFRPLLNIIGDALRELVVVLGEGKGVSDCRIESTA